MLLRRHKVVNTVGVTKKVAPTPVKEIAKPVEQPQEDKTEYTKTTVNRMTTAELQNLGAEIGIKNADKKNGGILKTEIIEKLGL